MTWYHWVGWGLFVLASVAFAFTLAANISLISVLYERDRSDRERSLEAKPAKGTAAHLEQVVRAAVPGHIVVDFEHRITTGIPPGHVEVTVLEGACLAERMFRVGGAHG